MKTWKVYLALVALSFVVGLGLVATYAPSATAGEAPPEPTCEHSEFCSVTICGGPDTCPYGYVPYYECGMSPFCGSPRAVPCDCTFTGCGFPC
jgi:hypothetical protein